MKTLYLDCGMGAAGDMLTAALLELLPEPDDFIAKLNALGIPEVEFKREKTVKCGIGGTHISVAVHGIEEGDVMHDPHDHTHSHGQDHEHSHSHGQDHVHSHGIENDHGHDHGHSHENEYDREHEHSHENEHSHEHGHNHEHDTSHDQSQHHGYNHAHDTEGHGHHHEETGHHHHSSLHDIEHIVSNLHVPKKVQDDILAVYNLIAEAESHVHGVPVTEIHFHEVGTMDAIADVTAVCLLMDRLAPDEVVASPIHVGSGQVKCAHGILPVPAPATAYILRGAPIYGGEIRGELCTPTGAALLKHFVTRFGPMPLMRTLALGYGMGKKDFPMANCVRAMLGVAEDRTDQVLELSCNVDDMTAEAIGFAMERLFEGGALEVYTVPIGMKKSRPGTLLRVMCREQDKDKLLQLIFAHTTTIGIRETVTRRYVLDRKLETLSTSYGDVRCKVSSGYGVSRSKYEYEDLARIAREKNISLAEVRSLLDGNSSDMK